MVGQLERPLRVKNRGKEQFKRDLGDNIPMNANVLLGTVCVLTIITIILVIIETRGKK